MSMNVVKNWGIKDLDQLAIIDPEKLSEATQRSRSFYYIDIAAVSEGKITLPTHKISFSESPSRARKIVRRRDVLMSTVRPNLRAFAYFDHTDEDCVASTGFAVLRAKPDTDGRFILYAILSEPTLFQIDSHVAGSNYPAINISDVARLKILSPPFPEQAKIGEILSTVDRAIEQTEALIDKQQRIKTGLMQDLLTRGIDEHGNIRSEQTHQFKDSSLGRIPVEWEVCDIDSFADLVTSGSRGWAQYYDADGAIFLRIGNLTRNHIDLRLDDVVFVNPPKSAEENRTAVLEGDLLISITADLGIIGVIPEKFGEGYVNQHIALIRLSKKVNSRFVGWYLSGRGGKAQFEKLNESGAKAGLNLPTIRGLLAPNTARSEQDKIAHILDTNSQTIADLQLQHKKLFCVKRALMHDLLSGKKQICFQEEEMKDHLNETASDACNR